MEERCKLPSGSWQSPAAKRYLVHFGLKNASDERNFKGTFAKNMFVFSLFTSNNATSLGEAQIGQHITPCNIMLHFVSLYNLLSVVKPRRSRSAAAYSRQTFPWTICRSVRPYVRMYVST